MPDIHLYSFQGCPFARRTRMTLVEKGLDFELTEIDLKNRPANFAEISPYGKVPVLMHNGGRLYESAIINEYLNDVFPEPPLMPADPMLRAQARIWMDYCDSRFSSASWQFMQAGDDADKLAAARSALKECFEFIEHEGLRKLSNGPFWLGEHISLVDIQFMPFFQRYAAQPARAEIPADCSRLHDWLTLMSERESYLRTEPQAA